MGSRDAADFEMLADAARITLDTAALASELDVLPWVVKAFVGTLDLEQAQALLAQARNQHI